MKPLVELTVLQLSILNILWDDGEATVAQVHEALGQGLARKTVGTLLARLEQYGVLTHGSHGREFLYRAAVSRDEVRAARLRGLAETLFAGDPLKLVSFALSDEEASEANLEELRALIEAHKTDGPGD